MLDFSSTKYAEKSILSSPEAFKRVLNRFKHDSYVFFEEATHKNLKKINKN